MKKYDVIVVGGGMAGIGASLAAARQGADVLLLEQGGALGGAAVNSLVMPFMPYYTNVFNEKGEVERKLLTRGIFEEISKRLNDCNRYNIIDEFADFDSEYLKVVLDRMMCEYGVDVLFHSTVYDVVRCEREITAVKVSAVGGKYEFWAKSFIDCTGDANLCALSGCEFQLGREEDGLCQPMTLCFRVSNVCYEDFIAEKPEILKLYKKYREEGKIKNPRENVLTFKPLVDNMVHFNSTRIVMLNPTDPFELSRAEMQAREQMLELFTFLKENFKSFSNAQIAISAASIGVRESRMVKGEYTLTCEEILDTVKFDDAIAAGNYDIDIHNPEGSGTHHLFFKAGQYYTIPYGSLVVRDADNLLVAGRCISCDHRTQASIRTMPICCSTGEAAGVAAALLSKQGGCARDVNVKEIQEILINNGAFIKD